VRERRVEAQPQPLERKAVSHTTILCASFQCVTASKLTRIRDCAMRPSAPCAVNHPDPDEFNGSSGDPSAARISRSFLLADTPPKGQKFSSH